MTGLRMDSGNGVVRLDGMGRLLRAEYAPQFVSVSGMGNGLGHYHERQMLGGILASLFGKPQSWYDRISRIQKELTVLQAEVSGFGKEVWNTIAAKLAPAGEAGKVGLKYFSTYDWTMENLLARTKDILVTASKEPTDAQINNADIFAREVRGMVEFAKRMAPEMAAQVAADRAKVEANLRDYRLRSPAEAGETEFYKALEEQASKLGKFGLGAGLVVAGVAALVLLGMGARRNPRKKNDVGVIPLVAAGGGLLYLLSRKSPATTPTVPGMTVAALMPTVTATGITGYDEAVKRLDDIKTLYRSGRLTVQQARSEVEKLDNATQELLRNKVISEAQFSVVQSGIGSFRTQLA